jgi:hypothetical protein
MSKDLFVGLFRHYLDAIKYRIDENSKKLDFSKYQKQHEERIADLNEAQKIGNETQKSNEMKKINDKYFQYVKHVIFDLPTISINNAEEEILPVEENIEPEEYIKKGEKVIPVDSYSPSISIDLVNILVGAISGSSSHNNYYTTFGGTVQKSIKMQPMGMSGGSVGCADCIVGGKSPGIKFTDSRTKKYHNYLMIFYSIILHQYYEASVDAWKIVERYTEKMNELESEYKNGTGGFVDYQTREKDIKLETSLRKVTFDGYKEFNAIASRLRLGSR